MSAQLFLDNALANADAGVSGTMHVSVGRESGVFTCQVDALGVAERRDEGQEIVVGGAETEGGVDHAKVLA